MFHCVIIYMFAPMGSPQKKGWRSLISYLPEVWLALCLKWNDDSSSVFFTETVVTFLQECWLEVAYLLFYSLHDVSSVTIFPPLLILKLKSSIHKKFYLKSECFRINAIINHFTIHSFHMIMTHFFIQVFKSCVC